MYTLPRDLNSWQKIASTDPYYEHVDPSKYKYIATKNFKADFISDYKNTIIDLNRIPTVSSTLIENFYDQHQDEYPDPKEDILTQEEINAIEEDQEYIPEIDYLLPRSSLSAISTVFSNSMIDPRDMLYIKDDKILSGLGHEVGTFETQDSPPKITSDFQNKNTIYTEAFKIPRNFIKNNIVSVNKIIHWSEAPESFRIPSWQYNDKTIVPSFHCERFAPECPFRFPDCRFQYDKCFFIISPVYAASKDATGINTTSEEFEFVDEVKI